MGTELDGMDDVMPSSLQRELENYKFVFDQHAVISVTDAAGCIVDSNELFSKISAFHREELKSRIEEGHLMPDYVHMLISIPPKYSVSQVIVHQREKCNLSGASIR